MSVQHQTINVIDSFLINKLNIRNKHTPIVNKNQVLLKRISLQNILNVSLPRLRGKPKKNVQLKLRSKEKVPLPSNSLSQSQTYLKKHTNTKKKIVHEDPLVEKSFVNQTLRRSNRLNNKENITRLITSVKYQPQVVLSPIQSKSKLSSKKKEKNSNVNDRRTSKVSNCISVSDKNKLDVTGSRKSKRLSQNNKNKVQCSISSNLMLLQHNKNRRSSKRKPQNNAKNVNNMENKNKNKPERKRLEKKVVESKPINDRNPQQSKAACSKSMNDNQTTKDLIQASNVKNSFPQEKTVLSDDEPLVRKKGKIGSLGYMKERQHFLKNLLTADDPPDYYEVCKMKKNKALDNLLKLDEDETLSIMTPKGKEKSHEATHMTPRSSVLQQWEKLTSYPASTPKDASKSAAEDKRDALKVAYHYLKYNPSKKRKYPENNSKENQQVNAKVLRTHKNVDYLNALDEKEKQILSQTPFEKDSTDTSFDDYFNESI